MSELHSRYERTGEGELVIDIAVRHVEELYDDYDRSAPYIRRDLDQELVDYLIECAKELHPASFVIRFTLNQYPDSEKQSRVRRSINTYFLYLGGAGRREVRQMFRRSAILFGVGMTILFLAVYVGQMVRTSSSVVASVFSEGLTVAAWVSLWESLAVFLIEWFPHRKNIQLYRRLADTKIIFRLADEIQQKNEGPFNRTTEEG